MGRKCLDPFFFSLGVFAIHSFNVLIKIYLNTKLFFHLNYFDSVFHVPHMMYFIWREQGFWLDCGNKVFVVCSEKAKVSKLVLISLKAYRLEHNLNCRLGEFYISWMMYSFKKKFKRQNISFFTVVSNAVTKTAFCTTIPPKKQQGLLFKTHSSPHFHNRTWHCAFCRWQEE